MTTDDTANGALQPRLLIPFAIVTLIWGSTWLVIRDQLGPVPPSWSVSYRFFIASAGMFLFAAATRAPLRLSLRDQGFVLLIGLAQFVLNFNFVYRAEAHITSGLVAVVFALLVVPNAVLGRIFLGQTVSGRFILGSLIALAGVGLLFVHEARVDKAGTSEALLGIGLTLAGVFSASVANVMQGTNRARAFPIPTMLAWAMLYGAIADAALAWALTGPPVIETRIGYWLGTAYLGLFASALAFALYYPLIRKIGVAKASYSSVIVPILAMLLSTLFEGYRWSLLAAAGCAVAMAGLVIALSARRPARQSS